jgi:hypothetical protein
MATGRVPTTANSPLTAKGDLFTYSTAPARLAVGNNGESLVADSAATTGLRYSATPSASNPIINSAFQVWQRGTSMAGSATAFCADRWAAYRAVAGSTFSRQATGDTTNLPNIQYAVRVARDSGNTATGALILAQTFESVNSIPFAGKTITFSFYARAGANLTANLGVQLGSGTGTDQNWSGFTGLSYITNTTQALTTTWTRYTFTGTVATTATQLMMQFYYVPTGTAGAADYFEMTGVQIDIGSVALPFRTYAATIQGELAACQRYFIRLGQTVSYQHYVNGYNFATTVGGYTLQYSPLRGNPSITFSAANTFLILHGNESTATCTVVAADVASTTSFRIKATVASGLTAGQGSILINNAGAASTIDISAEL